MAGVEKQQHQDSSKRFQFPLDSESYKIVAEIGAGASAVVYKAICVPMNSTIVAIKDIDLDRARTDLEDIRREAKFLSLLSHPNILNAHCSFIVNRRLWVVMPFMSAGSLLSIITYRFPEGFSEPCIASVLKETLSAVSYLHDQGHLHRDIKAGNILIDSNGSVKLADFGVSASVYESRSILGGYSSSSSASGGSSSFMLTDVAGTPYWMAPEMIHSNTGYNFKADIWSFGITALELAYGRPPLSHLPPSKSLLLKITKRFRFSDYESFANDKNKKFSKNFKDMVGSCLQQDPSKRPTAERLLKHPFFKNCRSGSDILFKNVLQGLPSIEERFKEIKTQQGQLVIKKVNEDEDDDDQEWYVKQRRISGWNFNEEGCELDPVFPMEVVDDFVVKMVRFGGETIIPERDTTEVGVSSMGMSGAGSGSNTTDQLNLSSSTTEEEETQLDEVGQVGLTEVERNVDIGVGPLVGGQVLDKEAMVSGLLALKRTLDDQQEKVGSLIRVLQGDQGGEEMMRREEQMAQDMERLRAELESERRKNSELEMEVEILKLQISGEQSDAGAGSAEGCR